MEMQSTSFTLCFLLFAKTVTAHFLPYPYVVELYPHDGSFNNFWLEGAEISKHHPIILSPLCMDLLTRIWIYRLPVPTLHCPIQVPIILKREIANGANNFPNFPTAEYGNSGGPKCVPRLLEANSCVQRPLLYSPRDNQCYYAFSKGPCQQTQWFAPQSPLGTFRSTTGQCQDNPCQSLRDEWLEEISYDDDASPLFTFLYNEQCYSTNTTAFCHTANEVAYFDSPQGEILNPSCGSSQRFHQDCIPSTLGAGDKPSMPQTKIKQFSPYSVSISTSASLPCPGNQVKTTFGGCASAAKIERSVEMLQFS